MLLDDELFLSLLRFYYDDASSYCGVEKKSQGKETHSHLFSPASTELRSMVSNVYQTQITRNEEILPRIYI